MRPPRGSVLPLFPPTTLAFMCRRRAFTLVELLVVIGIIGILISILIPLMSKAQAAAKSVQCGSNLRQVGIGLTRYFNDFKHLPVRDGFTSLTNPHVFAYWTFGGAIDSRVADLMEKYVGSRKVLYCPANSLGRTVENYWPNSENGTYAGNYQYPFWLDDQFWIIPKPDYRRLTADRVLAADYLGVILDFDNTIRIVAWNHEKLQDGSPRGMNMLFGDGHVEWRRSENRWQMWGYNFESIYWFWANPS
jgi:prepilin-type N-terminal cleavage/methylation domain-containing protein/prepilin-type processing-associated H-X9-DG protein